MKRTRGTSSFSADADDMLLPSFQKTGCFHHPLFYDVGFCCHSPMSTSTLAVLRRRHLPLLLFHLDVRRLPFSSPLFYDINCCRRPLTSASTTVKHRENCCLRCRHSSTSSPLSQLTSAVDSPRRRKKSYLLPFDDMLFASTAIKSTYICHRLTSTININSRRHCRSH